MKLGHRNGAPAPVLVASLIVLFLPAASAWSQTRSVVTGTVTDETGAVLPGGTVVLESPDAVGGAQTVTTDE
jgi:hypothetical protein